MQVGTLPLAHAIRWSGNAAGVRPFARLAPNESGPAREFRRSILSAARIRRNTHRPYIKRQLFRAFAGARDPCRRYFL